MHKKCFVKIYVYTKKVGLVLLQKNCEWDVVIPPYLEGKDEGKDDRGQYKAHRKIISSITIGTILQKQVGAKEPECWKHLVGKINK